MRVPPITVTFHTYAGEKITGRYASIEAEEVRVRHGREEALFTYADAQDEWLLASARGVDTTATALGVWESWQDAAYAVLGLNLKPQYPH